MDQETKQEFENLAVMVQGEFNELRKEFKDDLKQTEDRLRGEMGKMKLDILDAMDDKIVNLKGDLVLVMRKEDRKVVSLIELLKTKKIISNEEAGTLLSLEPFPQLMA